MKKLLLPFFCLLILLCSCKAETNSDNPKIIATMFPQYDFAREIAGANADIELLLDFGTDAHSYEPAPADILEISKADLFIYTGNEMEIWAKALLESSDIKKAIDAGTLHILDLSKADGLTLLSMDEHSHDEEHGHEHTEFDTHIWTSPKNAVKMCEAISLALCEIDAENADVYKANTENYITSLTALSEAAAKLAENPTNDTVYFGGSFAFRYLFADIGLKHVSIYEGCSSHAEPSAADIAKIVSELKASNANYVLYDSPSEKKIADSIAVESGAEVLHLHAIHNITKAEFEKGENYLSLMQSNLETLRKAIS